MAGSDRAGHEHVVTKTGGEPVAATGLGDEYRRNGFVARAGLLDGAGVSLALAHLTRTREVQQLPPDAPIVAVAPGTGPVSEVATSRPLGDLASELLGEPAVPFGLTYFCKPARNGLPALWHQDGAPWATLLAGAPALTLWVALDDADATNGCLRVIPGSHRLSAQPLRPNAAVPSIFGVEMNPALVDETQAVDVVLRAGDGSVHHPQLIHGSGPNRSLRPRRALAIRYRGRPA